MFDKIEIKGFKSIVNDTIELGRVNVFIGENGCGKSNILEAFAYLSTEETAK
ncbi:MAG: AAA family ATPase [Saprospiraceae bacterium]|nr:AAA family ATPase [Saprospiraceae bacterium]